MSAKQPRILSRADWASHPELWKGHVEGHSLGTGVTVLFYATEEIGAGPRLHVHDYDEFFIIGEGRARHCQRKQAEAPLLALPHFLQDTGSAFLGSKPKAVTGGRPAEGPHTLPRKFPLTMPVPSLCLRAVLISSTQCLCSSPGNWLSSLILCAVSQETSWP